MTESQLYRSGSVEPERSKQVAWFEVHEYVAQLLTSAGSWPTAGTPAWCALPDDDLHKLAAVLDGGRHWALHLDVRQEAMAEASRDVAGAADWPAIAREVKQRSDFYAARPWLKRVAS